MSEHYHYQLNNFLSLCLPLPLTFITHVVIVYVLTHTNSPSIFSFMKEHQKI